MTSEPTAYAWLIREGVLHGDGFPAPEDATHGELIELFKAHTAERYGNYDPEDHDLFLFWIVDARAYEAAEAVKAPAAYGSAIDDLLDEVRQQVLATGLLREVFDPEQY